MWWTDFKAVTGVLMMAFAGLIHIAVSLNRMGLSIGKPSTYDELSEVSQVATLVFLMGWVCWSSARMDRLERKTEQR